MQYGQIVLLIIIGLAIYYVVLIAMDIRKANAEKALEAENNNEEDIDISDEAKQFVPVKIFREEKPKKQEANAEADTDNNDKPADKPADKAADKADNKTDEAKDKQGSAEPSKQDDGKAQPVASQSQESGNQAKTENVQTEKGENTPQSDKGQAEEAQKQESPQPPTESESTEEDGGNQPTLKETEPSTQNDATEQPKESPTLKDGGQQEQIPVASKRSVVVMTGAVSIDALIVEVDKFAETGHSDLGCIMYECEKEMHNA